MTIEHILAGLMIAVFAVAWGRDCGAWARAHGTSSGAACWRAFSVPMAIVLGSQLLIHSTAQWLLTLLCVGAVCVAVGIGWERRKYPEPSAVRPAWNEPSDFQLLMGPPGYHCWKCGRFKMDAWPFEARIQDREQKGYAFAWHPVCPSCAEKGART